MNKLSFTRRVFANGPGDQISIPGRVISKTQKIVLDANLLKTQHYKVRIKGKLDQSREWRSALLYTSVLQLLKTEPLGCPQLRSPNIIYIYIYIYISSVCVCVYACVIYIYIYIYIYISTNIYVSMSIYIYIYIYIYACVRACVCVCLPTLCTQFIMFIYLSIYLSILD